MMGRLIAILLCTTLYTVVRYVTFGDVSPVHLPVFLLNKSVAMASVVLLSCAALSYSQHRIDRLRYWGMASLHCACIHVLLSLAVLSSAYYPKFFGTEKMNVTGELTILLGVLATYCFWLAHSGRSVSVGRGMFQLLASLFVVGHLIAMGLQGWLKVAKWHGGLPPISLVSLVFAVASLVLFSRSREEQSR
jgi:hypothetical protein